VSDKKVLGAVSALSMLSPVDQVVKPEFYDLSTPENARVKTKQD
jgi:hypothetical protein